VPSHTVLKVFIVQLGGIRSLFTGGPDAATSKGIWHQMKASDEGPQGPLPRWLTLPFGHQWIHKCFES
jgi:hypothetical protein